LGPEHKTECFRNIQPAVAQLSDGLNQKEKMMKSKLFLMMIMMAGAFTFTTAAHMQSRSNKIVLPCSAVVTSKTTQTPNGSMQTHTLTAKAKNDTGSWLAEGKTLHFTLKAGSLPLASDREFVLDAMIPVDGSVKLWEQQYAFKVPFDGPYTCQAWYFK
jgi:hypothetical protein